MANPSLALLLVHRPSAHAYPSSRIERVLLPRCQNKTCCFFMRHVEKPVRRITSYLDAWKIPGWRQHMRREDFGEAGGRAGTTIISTGCSGTEIQRASDQRPELPELPRRELPEGTSIVLSTMTASHVLVCCTPRCFRNLHELWPTKTHFAIL